MSISGLDKKYESNHAWCAPLKLSEERAKCLFSIYSKFLEKHSSKMGGMDALSELWAADFSETKECPFEWQDLDVSFPFERMRNVLNNTGVLMLRPVFSDSKVLVIGCGNKPIADCGGLPLAAEADDHEDSEIYRKIHTHLNAITINPHLASNAGIIGFFGFQKFPMLKSGQFDLIVIEGTRIPDTNIAREELKRLQSPNCVVVSSMFSKGYEFSWEDNAKSIWKEGYEFPEILIDDLNVFESFNYESKNITSILKRRKMD